MTPHELGSIRDIVTRSIYTTFHSPGRIVQPSYDPSYSDGVFELLLRFLFNFLVPDPPLRPPEGERGALEGFARDEEDA